MCSLVLISCKINLNEGFRIDPSSNIVKNEYTQPAFDKIDIDVCANVKFIQSADNNHRVVLSCPDNYVELFKFEVNSGELSIDFTRENTNIEARNVDITIYAPTLHKLENSGVASVEIDKLKTDQLSIENSGVGSLYINGLKADKLEAECSGVGNVELGGVVDKAMLECSGVGSIKAESLKAKSVSAEVSGVGGIKCYASESIDGEVSGVGSLQFGGHPQKKNLQRTGVGNFSEL